MKIIQLPADAILQYRSLWDGCANTLQGPGSFRIHQKTICAANAKLSHATIVDMSRYTIMPALIDCHAHLSLPTACASSIKIRMDSYLQSGVAAIRDAGMKETMPIPQSPLLCRHSLQAIFKKGFYGSALGTAAATPEEACQAVDRLAQKGAAQIKIIASGIFSFDDYGQTGPLPFTVPELSAMIRRAKQHGLPVMAHASGDEAVRLCIAAGVTSIEHGYFMSDQTLKELADSGIYWVPTLAPVAAQLADPKLSVALSPAQRDTIARSLDRHRQLVQQADRLGVRVCAGTDAGAPGVPHGSSLVTELTLLQEAGLSTANTLMAATSRAAELCGLPGMGFLRHGKTPCILVLTKNPLESLHALRSPAALLLP